MLNFPAIVCELSLTHNEHKSDYQTVDHWVENHKVYRWDSEDAKQRAIDTNEVWTLHWYPDNPVGFYAIAAPTLEELLEMANR